MQHGCNTDFVKFRICFFAHRLRILKAVASYAFAAKFGGEDLSYNRVGKAPANEVLSFFMAPASTMALDVALAYVLYHAGVPTPYVAVLLCTLGPVSVYSLSALGKQLDWRTSLRLGGAVALLGCVAGLIAMKFSVS